MCGFIFWINYKNKVDPLKLENAINLQNHRGPDNKNIIFFDDKKKLFQNQKNIKIIQADFTRSDFFQYDADCYFLNNPFVSNTEYFASKPNIKAILLKKNSELIEFIEIKPPSPYAPNILVG